MTRYLSSLLTALSIASVATWGGSAAQAQASPKALAAQEGVVQATVTYPDTGEESGTQALPGLRIEISRGGKIVYSQPVSSHACLEYCGLESFGGGPLLVKDLEGNGEPAVVLELNTGGAHCCTVVQVFSFDPGTMTYAPFERDFGDPGAVLTDLAGDRHLEFESADDRFAYEFAPYAYSGLPLQVWRFQEGRFLDATREFPKAVATDARRQFKGFLANRRQGYGLGLIAAWAADQELLGHSRLVRATLTREATGHRLRNHEALHSGGSTFVKRLMRFLKRTGYS